MFGKQCVMMCSRMLLPRRLLARTMSLLPEQDTSSMSSVRFVHALAKTKLDAVEDSDEWKSEAGSWSIRILRDRKHIQDAKALLYRNYIKEMGWTFHPDNPTGFKIETSECGEKILTDNLESHSDYCGAFYGNRLVGVMRMVYRNDSGELDMTRYISKTENYHLLPVICHKNNPHLVEIQRCAIEKDFNNKTVFPRLMLFLLERAYSLEMNAIGTTANERLKHLFGNVLQADIIETEFTYSENKDGPASVFYGSVSKLPDIIEKLRSIIDDNQGIRKMIELCKS